MIRGRMLPLLSVASMAMLTGGGQTLQSSSQPTPEMERLSAEVVPTALSVAPVSLRKDDRGWSFVIDGKPFFVKGLTWVPGAYDEQRWRADFEHFRKLGANALRVWSADEQTPRLLDLAQEYGMKVLVGLWLRHGRPGADDDDSFDWVHDLPGRELQWRDAVRNVVQLREHPAVLGWALGNEVIFNIETEEQKVAYSQFLGSLAAKIKEIDPAHPITSVSAWVHELPYWQKYCPALDYYGINSYGFRDTGAIPERLRDLGITKPYLITEFGVRGEWEIEPDARGVKLEPADGEKYEILAKGWSELVVANQSVCLGGFIFHMGNKLDHLELWHSLRIQGKLRPSYWGTYKAFTGKEPDDQPPRIRSFSLSSDRGEGGTWVTVQLEAEDAESQPLDVQFHYNERQGPRHYRDAVHPLPSRLDSDRRYEIRLPRNVQDSSIKVYAVVADAVNLSAATASIHVLSAAHGPYGLRARLPFRIYAEGDEDHHFVPSGWMGNRTELHLDLKSSQAARQGQHGVKIEYSARGGWVGVAWQRPEGDWGDQPGAVDLGGAKRLSFWARGALGGEELTVHFGLIEPGRAYPDSARLDTGQLELDSSWREYVIDLSKADLDHIKTPFAFFVRGQFGPVTIYLDDITVE